MFKKSLGRNSLGVDRIFHYDPDQKRTWIEYHQDVQPILDHSQKIRNDTDVWKKGVKNSMALYATIPPLVQLKWIQEYGLHNDPMAEGNGGLLFRLLNSRDYGYLKCTDKIHIPQGAKTA
jgi:hypothetical protein